MKSSMLQKTPYRGDLSWRDRLNVFSYEKEGKFFLNNKNWSQAEEVFSQLIDCGDIYWVYLGRALLGQKKYKEAKECFEKVIPQASLYKEWAFWAFKGLGMCLCYLGDDEASIENLNKASALKKNVFDEEMSLCYGILFKNRKDWSAAKKEFQSILEKNQKNDEAWAHIAEVWILQGDLELAHTSLQQALDLNPANKTALRMKVRYSLELSSTTGNSPLFSFRA